MLPVHRQIFPLFNRRHHCRKCGMVFCGTCCPVSKVLRQHVPEQLLLASSPDTYLSKGFELMAMKRKTRFCLNCTDGIVSTPKVLCKILELHRQKQFAYDGRDSQNEDVEFRLL